MLKTVIYARYSSDKQNEQSIEGQIHECEQFAKTHDMVIIKHYVDRALSGKTDDRPSFLQMIKDSSSGLFDAVLVYKTDRFARNRYDSAVYKAKLKKNGINMTVYSDSAVAQKWVRDKRCNTKVVATPRNAGLLELVRRAETWLASNTYKNPILKWQTERWGEIPADFGRK